MVRVRNNGSGKTEVHTLDHTNSYAVPTGDFATIFGPNEWQNGKFQVPGGGTGADLFYIKLRNTTNRKIEIHQASAASKYLSLTTKTETAFSLDDAERGTWTVDDGNLFLIKTNGTSSNMIEIHRASQRNYQQFDLHIATSFSASDAENGKWIINGGNLFFVKYRNTRGQKVEVHVVRAIDGYQRVELSSTWFKLADGEVGTWDIGPNEDLYLIKTRDIRQKIEVYIATASSMYQDVYSYVTWIGKEEGPNGEWSVQ